MKRNKQSGFRKTRLAIKANPQFGQRVEKPLKGKGSYKRKKTRTADYFAKVFAKCFSKIVCQKKLENQKQWRFAMRILIGCKRAYPVDRICPTARDGKRVLKEYPVSVLYLDYFLGCRDTGVDILKWALQHGIAPARVVLVSSKRDCRDHMGRTLSTRGYRTADGINYLLT